MRQKKKLIWMLAAILVCGLQGAVAQIVRGTVNDAISGEPLAGATVKIADSDVAKKSAVTDKDGRYRIDVGQAGRYALEASMVGYEPQRVVEVLVAGRNAANADFQLRELVEQLGEVTVRPVVNKAQPLNPTAVVGATLFSVEEATRFAGAFDGLGRVLRRYTGTTGSTDNAGISTHGNPPSTTMYRVEGVEVPSPVHFENAGAYGTGEMSVIHMDMLANSDYYTAAAPAEMGNTLGGAVDLRLRPGSNTDYRHSVKFATLGLDATSEVPLSKTSGSSYIVSYRYALTTLSRNLGMAITDGEQADYHDLTFKLNFPLGTSSTISLWGIGAWDKSFMDWDEDDQEWNTLYEQDDLKNICHTLTGGLTYDTSLPHQWRLAANLVAARRHATDEDGFALYAADGSLLTHENHKSVDFAPATPYVKEDQTTLWLTAAVAAQKRFSSHYLLKLGTSLRHIDYEMSLLRAKSFWTGLLQPAADADKTMQQVDAYATNNLRFGRWTLNAGLHLAGWTLSDDWSVQPRLSAEWRPADGHSLSAGYGMTTRTASLDTYFAAPENRDLKPMRSHQVVLDYKWQPSTALTLKAEAWAEWQSDVPVSPTTTFCVLNRRLFFLDEALTDEGRARNYGVSTGIEHYMTDGLYWMLNGSLYKSEYRAADRVWRPTYYDRGWTVNAVAGKEWTLKGRHILSANIATTAMGGLRQSPFDEDATAAAYAAGYPYAVHIDSRAMSLRNDPVVDLSLNVSYRIHGKKVDQVIGFDYMNILAQEEPYFDFYNYVDHCARTAKQCYSMPNISYSIIF